MLECRLHSYTGMYGKIAGQQDVQGLQLETYKELPF